MGLFVGLALLLFIIFACSSVLAWRALKPGGSPPEFSQLQESFDELAAHLAALEAVKEFRDQLKSPRELSVVNPDTSVIQVARDLCNFHSPVCTCGDLAEFLRGSV